MTVDGLGRDPLLPPTDAPESPTIPAPPDSPPGLAEPLAADPFRASGGDDASSDDSATGKVVAQRAAEETSEVKETAKEGAKEVAHDAAEQVKAVAGQARQQFDRVVEEAGGQLREQAEQQTTRAATGLRTLSDQVSALAAGRTDEAGPLLGYLDEAQTKVQGFAERLESGGPQGLVDDLTSFARRRPGLFLAGAAGVGFVVGRLARSGAAANSSDDAPETAGAMP